MTTEFVEEVTENGVHIKIDAKDSNIEKCPLCGRVLTMLTPFVGNKCPACAAIQISGALDPHYIPWLDGD